MEIINRRQRMSSLARKLRREGQTIGLVPTMGALHEGHLSLVREARALSDVVAVSIFVNPTQFGPGEDFERYPRNLTHDAALLANYNVDCIFAPAAEEIYPKNFSTFVVVERLSEQLEGASRPGHFRGVTTVVAILLNIVRPDFVFFGQKDAQQGLLIKQVVRDLVFPTEVVVVPTVREVSGLATSSRNQYLNEEERRAGGVLFRALSQAREAYNEGERSAASLIELVRSIIEEEPQVRIDYISVNDSETLQKVERLDDRPVLISLAVYIGNTRLIDNLIVGKAKKQDAAGARA
jgi:pantoate--beta-alanine ligase